VTTYECKACGKPATFRNGYLARDCQCNAPIIANLKATATGESQVASGR
jgi:hypothetical protein